MNLGIVTYLIYLAVSIGMTVWVANSLRKNGRYFLIDVFHGDAAMADSVNQLLVVGFYLINLGYISLMLKLGYLVPDLTAAIEAISQKVGMVLIVLGAMHFFNLFVFSRIRRRSHEQRPVQQIPPDGYQPTAEPAQTPYYLYQRAAEEK